MNNPIEELIRDLYAGDDAARKQALETLTKLSANSLEPLIAALADSSDVTIRRGAALLLRNQVDSMIVPPLIHAVANDPDLEVRVYAAQALARQQDARALEPLIAVLTDSDPAVREEAVRALGQIVELLDSPRTVGALAGALIDTDWGTRQSAAEMLVRLNADLGGQAEKLLVSDLEHDDAEVRLGAAASLAELGDTRALEALIGLLLNEDSRIVESAARILGTLGDQRAVSPLTTALSHADESVQNAVRDALRRLGTEA